ncbi:hypothetical protein D1164_14915 [Mariniphaga sediminis]|jgi:hypothetical protein|uniref:Thioredoxin n=1 Tax=Mariniphaga sediminis TaxID=1628158 RepID=A0A399CY71_9BACT|nr:nitrophenyl compound nitroreductase subunit ArsF family protein [Mariniphaga sediminis]MBD3623003.1 hypothetical protein [Sunxiuqinia sp.]RIH64379.1 hypothetical protein D1164_14915 [Mariniphaga sediminis]
MKTKINATFFVLIFSLLAGLSISAQPAKQNQEKGKAKVNVYYFHFNTRCATCRTVESEARQNVEDLFGKEARFASYNLDNPAGEAKGKELGVNSQCLIVVKEDTIINITKEGFMYARTAPEKFKKVIEEKINSLL